MINHIEIQEFDDIARGTSITIPVLFKRLDGTPFDLTFYSASFTLKSVEFDYDYDDVRARIAKPILIEEPEEGRFDIQLSSHETWLPPGTYYFDIELERGDGIHRVCFFKTNIVGGPSNRNTNRSEYPIAFQNAISITMGGVRPLVFVTPLISDPPENLIETIQASPTYLLEELNEPDEPVRDVMIHCYAPKVSFVMSFTNPNNALPRSHPFENYSFYSLPDGCPLKGGKIVIDRREVRFELAEHSPTMKVWDSYIQHHPTIITDGHFHELASDEPFFVGDNVTHGSLNIIIEYENRRMIHIHGNYTMPRHTAMAAAPGEFYPSHWVFRIDYFDWT